MAAVTSRDGTLIAYERTGSGPALILIEAAGHYLRDLSSFDGLVGLLAPNFTVYRYDRRGRGDSGDTPPYAVEREVEDLAALIEQAGGTAFLYGFSSGALLALHAAAAGLAVPRLALLEPPVTADEERPAQRTFTAGLTELLAAGRRDDAVRYFLDGIGVPEQIVAGMRATGAWSAMAAVAPTLRYDCVISEATSDRLLATVTVPALVLDSAGSGDELTGMAATVAKGMPDAEHRSLPGTWHGVDDDALAPVLTDFFLR